MRKADFDNPRAFRNRGKETGPMVQPSEMILYEETATGNCFRVSVDGVSYRQCKWAANPSAPPSAWYRLSM